ncbi:monooxygenase [Acinetobacter pullicarnis]|uniref:monooxygenase n=1 Tax=Acinetobacter pullicarnis TaxID=2576829 RepID=UPI0011220E6C|nr:monooxygenase [Acinetobacter pullicarnis]
MSYLLQVDFSFSGPWGDAMTESMQGLANSITQEPGLIWKIWTENQTEQQAGGVYLFDTEAHAQAYLDMHAARLTAAGVTEIRSRIFLVNAALSEITQFSA